MRFQILDANDCVIPYAVLDKEAATLWGKEVSPDIYSYPGKGKSIFMETFNWFDVIGWAITHQENMYSQDSWENIVASMCVKDLGEKCITGLSFNDINQIQNDIADYIKIYQPMLDLINVWKEKGYKPKTI